MAPVPPDFHPWNLSIAASTTLATRGSLTPRSDSSNPYYEAERAAWRNPKDIITLLMLVGGDLIECAIQQGIGYASADDPMTWFLSPVAFSFGWVAYTFSLIAPVVSDEESSMARSSPDACVVLDVASGASTTNRSWALARLMRAQTSEVRKRRGARSSAPLDVEFYRLTGTLGGAASSRRTRPSPGRANEGTGSKARRTFDAQWPLQSGVLTTCLQLGIAAIPGATHGNWVVIIITAVGIYLAIYSVGTLRGFEGAVISGRKASAKPDALEVVCLTQGIESGVAMVIVNETAQFRLLDLAGTNWKNDRSEALTLVAGLMALWMVLLLATEGLESDGWYLLAVSALGTVQNAYAAWEPKSVDAYGFVFEPRQEGDVIREDNIMDTLKAAEEHTPGVGLALLPLFHPGELQPEDQSYWEGKRRRAAATEATADTTADAPPGGAIAAETESPSRRILQFLRGRGRGQSQSTGMYTP